MKIVCLCQRGNSRSVGLAFLLKEKGHEAIAVGMLNTSRETREMLYKWSDKIILTFKGNEHWIPEEYHSKLKTYDVGSDRYFMGFKPELVEQFKKYMKEDGL